MNTLVRFSEQKRGLFYLALGLICALLFLPFQSAVPLFDWDEVNFAELAREMALTGNYLQPQFEFRPFTEKPPLFFWLQALSMQLFGLSEFSARFPNALAGFATLAALFTLGRELFGSRFGLLWMIAYLGSTLPHLYFRSGLIDPWFNLFIFLSIADLFRHQKRESNSAMRLLIRSGVWLGLAVLTKGPAAILIVGLTTLAYESFTGFKWLRRPLELLVFAAACLSVSLVWYGTISILHGPDFAIEFTLRQWALLTTPDAGHGGFPGYHFAVLLLGCFPASVFALSAIFEKGRKESGAWGLWMLILLSVVLILFSLVRSKIVHYSSLAYFPLSFWAAICIERRMATDTPEAKKLLGSAWKALGSGLSLLYALASIALVWIGRHPGWIQSKIVDDAFAKANFEAVVDWPYATFAAALVGLIASILWWIPRVKPSAIFLVHALWVQLALYSFPQRIERYSQRASVEFFKELRGRRAYVATFGFKSYVPFYYSERRPEDAPPAGSNLLVDPLEYPAYFVLKTGKEAEFEAVAVDEKKLRSENGFVFYVREGVRR